MSVQQLKEEIKKNLDRRGVLREIKAKIRAEVYSGLQHPEDPLTGNLKLEDVGYSNKKKTTNKQKKASNPKSKTKNPSHS